MATDNGSPPERRHGTLRMVIDSFPAAVSAGWIWGSFLMNRIRIYRRSRPVVFLSRCLVVLSFCGVVGLLLWLAWFIPRDPGWRSTITEVVQGNPVFLGVLLLSVAVPFFWMLLWKLPQWQVATVPEPKDRLDLELKSRQTMAQIVGGAALLLGLYFTAQTLRTTHEGQITDRFTKAIAQLGDDHLAIRLGGIYALERIARDSAADHRAVIPTATLMIDMISPRLLRYVK